MSRVTQARRAARVLLCLAATPLLMASQCEEPLVNDSGFDIWCGDGLCDWQVDAGGVAKIPTWHAHDFGVALVGNPAAISQLLPFGSEDVSCIHFDLLANVDPGTSVVLALDFDDDGGAPEHAETIPSGAWTAISYHLTTPTYFQKVRISIRKTGDGQVELAQIAAAKSSDCSDAPPAGRSNRPLGATCEMASQCAGGLCLDRTPAAELIADATVTRRVCGSCAGDGDCAAGTVCGLGWSPAFLEPFPACAPALIAVLGDRCLVDSECASGTCCGGVCSTCCWGRTLACAPGAICQARAQDADGKPLRTAWQCQPGSPAGTTAAPCLAGSDCSGGVCSAGAPPLKVCAADGRRCAADNDCPRGAPGNPCIAIGVAGGSCQ